MDSPIEFGTDGIRGVAGTYPLSPEAVLATGRAIGRWLRENAAAPTAIIGRDTRPSGEQITHALLAGLTAEGIAADDVGVMTTPGIAYLTHALGYSLGIVISASHNPADQNGIKVIGSDGFKLSDEAEAAIEALIMRYLADPPISSGFGRVHRAEQHRSRYLQHLLTGLAPDALQGLSVVLDCANGASYAIAPEAFARLGAAVTALGTAPTGDNINVRSGSEHVRRHSETLRAMIADSNADVGIAFDGDADRVIFLTPRGTLIDGDHILALLADHLLQHGDLPGPTVVATTMSNSGLEHYLSQRGITLERTKVGDRYVMERMRAGGFRLGGEQAGHIILLDAEHTAGDGIYIGLQVAALIARQRTLLEDIACAMPRYPQVIVSTHLTRQVPLEGIPALQPLVDETLAAFDHQGRVNMRYSGTEPNLLRAMVEGGPRSSMDEVIERALALCRLVIQAGQSDSAQIDIVDCATGAKIDANRYR
ncbi:MAG: phosphoglucosamine mutase [Anaerolineae bacterium]|nr:phosphoglucosamine mutase [Anaerolineae bacterium]